MSHVPPRPDSAAFGQPNNPIPPDRKSARAAARAAYDEAFRQRHANAIGGDIGLGAAIKGLLPKDETVQVVIRGVFKQAVVGTERRLYVVKRGFFTGTTFGKKVASWEYKTITSIQLETRAASSFLIVRAGGEAPIKESYWATGKGSAANAPNAITFATRPSQEVIRSVARLNELLSAAHSPQSPHSHTAESPADQIRKLSELRDAGLLTAEEFAKKKRELLDRM